MIGINGFGRIGRLVFRSAFESNKGLLVSAVNDPMMDIDTFTYLLKYDSAHQRFPLSVEKWEKGVIINGHKVTIYNELDPTKIPWG